MTEPARSVALRSLLRIEREHAFSNEVLAAELDRASLSQPDRGLVTHLVYGTLRNRARLDHHLDASAHAPGKLKLRVRMLLRMAALELLELQRPVAIAAAEYGKLAHALDPSGRLTRTVRGIVSAIHRDAAAREDALAQAPLREQLTQAACLPPWYADKLVRDIGNDRARARAVAMLVPLPIDLRVDLTLASREGVRKTLLAEQPHMTLSDVAWDPHALRTSSGSDLFASAPFKAGHMHIQGLGAQQAARMLAPQPGEWVLDACCGPGGKTLQLGALMEWRGQLVAVDRDAAQLKRLHSALARVPLRVRQDLSCITAQADLTDAAQVQGPFDAVLLDAPCSGLGNLARHPELRWLRQSADISAHVPMQTALLQQCMARVRPGGRLVYAVCSLEPEEGPAIVHEACKDGRAVMVQTRAWTPEDDSTEGFFAAELRHAP